MRRPTNITIACIVILIIVIICIVVSNGNKGTSNNNENTQSNNNISYNTGNTINENENVKNEIQNTVSEEPAQNEIENIAENGVNSEPENDVIPTETFTEMPQDAQEKALKIVENDWTGSDVSFSVTGMDANGNYIVQVTDINTEVLAFYTVNVSEGSFTKKEMN